MLTVEQANAHDSGDCGPDCPHPDCTWVGVVDLALLLPDVLFDSPEALEPVYL